MMRFLEERGAFADELDAWYAAYPTDLSAVAGRLSADFAAHPERWPAEHKSHGYAVMAAYCPVHVFRHFPFYGELNIGKSRTCLGSGEGVGDWLKLTPFGQALLAQGCAWWAPCGAHGLSDGWPVLDDNHHTLGYDLVLRAGVSGLLRNAEDRLRVTEDERTRAFYAGMCAGLRALLAVAERCAEEAARLAAGERDAEIRTRLLRMADTAWRIPAEPPATFYEALCAIFFLREVTQSLDGSGISVLGHLDRMLYPYYARDLEAGRLTPEEARDLLSFFLAFSDARFGMRVAAPWHVGTNSTVVIGGCAADGAPIFNALTRMIVELYAELRLVDPKLNARISAQHSREYADLLATAVAGGGNTLAIFNDDVIIAANVRAGKRLEDSRCYVGGGCQENVLENTEVNSRATIYLNLAQVLLMGMFPEQWRWFTEREPWEIAPYAGCESIDAFYQVFLENLCRTVDAHIDQRNRTEREGWRYNPCPLHSAMIADCLETGRDMMDGGARYNAGSVSLTGVGTLIDALLAVRALVYDRRALTLDRLADALQRDFQGDDLLRRDLLRLPKYGQEDEDVYAFSSRVFTDLARVSQGRDNTRGGRYEASLFAFRSFTAFGERTGATPDGRHAGEHLSPGMSPSSPALGRECSSGQVLNAIAPLDLTDYPVVAVLDLTLPMPTPAWAVTPIIQRFLQSGGSVLQCNVVDMARLREARAHPEHHPDLVVRVSGYSGYFTQLVETIQEEILARPVAR